MHILAGEGESKTIATASSHAQTTVSAQWKPGYLGPCLEPRVRLENTRLKIAPRIDAPSESPLFREDRHWQVPASKPLCKPRPREDRISRGSMAEASRG